MAEAEATSPEAASETLGIPANTIRYWLDQPEFVELRAKSQQEFADGFKVLALKAQARLETLIPTMEPRDLTTLMGVSTDKALLMSGHATQRTEHRDLADEFDDHERAALRKAIDAAG